MTHEALRVKLIGDVEHLLTLLQDGAGLLVVHHGRREQCQARVVLFFVVPTKKSLRESATVLNAAEAVGKLRTIFHGAELTLRIGIVIGDMRTAMGLGDSQVGQEESNRLGAHRGAAIGMQSELTGEDALFGATVLDEPLCQFGTFAHGNHPAGDVATEHIEDHVEVEVRPFRGT
jgi:hypothetical protein